MFKQFSLFSVTVIILSISAASVNADFIGSQAFEFTVTPSTGTLNNALSLSDVTSSSTQSGDFALPTPLSTGTMWADFSLNLASSVTMPLLISNPDFGTFNGSVTGDTGEVFLTPGFFRIVSASGIFTPGSNAIYSGDTDPVMANLLISLGRADGNVNTVIDGSLTLSTIASSVPEPSSIALLGFATICFVAGRRRRKKTLTVS